MFTKEAMKDLTQSTEHFIAQINNLFVLIDIIKEYPAYKASIFNFLIANPVLLQRYIPNQAALIKMMMEFPAFSLPLIDFSISDFIIFSRYVPHTLAFIEFIKQFPAFKQKFLDYILSDINIYACYLCNSSCFEAIRSAVPGNEKKLELAYENSLLLNELTIALNKNDANSLKKLKEKMKQQVQEKSLSRKHLHFYFKFFKENISQQQISENQLTQSICQFLGKWQVPSLYDICFEAVLKNYPVKIDRNAIDGIENTIKEQIINRIKLP